VRVFAELSPPAKEEYLPQGGEVVWVFNNRYNNVSNTLSNRKQLRNHSSPPEKRLWIYIKNSQLGFKFRRQHSIDNYILDFYCPAKHLAIEIDGSTHDNPKGYAYDQIRTNWIKEKRIIILRFTNVEIMKNLDGVLAEIKKNLI
jgi:very-short-patch-repair endonuclease